MSPPQGQCEGNRKMPQTMGSSLNLPRIPWWDCDQRSRESHGGLSGFTINSNWKTNMRHISNQINTTYLCSGGEQNIKTWWPNNSPSLKTPLTVNDSSVFCKRKNIFAELIKRNDSRWERKADDKCWLTEQTWSHRESVYVNSEGGDVVLSFGQLVEESHHVQSCVLQKSKSYR